MRYLAILILLSNVLIGCANQVMANNTIKIAIGNQQIAHDVSLALTNQGIWNQVIEGGNIKIRKKNEDINLSLAILNKITQEYLPSNRHFSIDVDNKEILIQKFKAKNLEFRIVKLKGNRYVVWGEKDQEMGKRIIEEYMLE